MNIVLIGFMCSGKSKVGELLSKRIGWPHFDTDAMIVKNVGAPIADIIKKRGEPEFREIEKMAVMLVSSHDQAIISTGGGVPLSADNRKALSQNGILVWLKVSPETVLKRAGNLASRPLIDPKDPLGSIRSLMADRESAYASATHQIDTEGLTTAQVADKILALVPVKAS